MKFVLALLLTLAMTVSAYASAGQVRVCCPDEECSVAQCLDMGCMPAANPVAPLNVQAPPRWDGVLEVPEEISLALPSRYKEVWTPPD